MKFDRDQDPGKTPNPGINQDCNRDPGRTLPVNNSGDINLDTMFPFKDNCHYKFNLQDISLVNHPSNNLTVMNFNIRSIQSNFYKLTNDLLNCKTFHPNIIILTETWLNKDSNINDYLINGYNTPIIQNRPDGRGGGVMIYIDCSINNYRTRNNLSFADNYNNCLTIEVDVCDKNVLITGVYRSPSYNNMTFQAKFDKIVSQINNQHYDNILAGDFN